MGGLAGAAGGGSAACAWAAPAWWLAPLLLLGAGAGAWAHAWSGRAVRTSVLAVRGVGVQLRSERRSGACCHQAFVPAERIAHAVVNECVEFNDVTTYLALQLRDEAGPRAGRPHREGSERREEQRRARNPGEDWQQFVPLFQDDNLSVKQMAEARRVLNRVLQLTPAG